MPLLRDYIAEHERAINFGGEAVRAIDRGDLARARHLLGELVREHRDLAQLLATVDISKTDGQQAIRDAVSNLYEHISKEEDGLFPASLTALSGDEWDASINAWHAAHPDRRMISR
jgi:hypothetical protein